MGSGTVTAVAPEAGRGQRVEGATRRGSHRDLGPLQPPWQLCLFFGDCGTESCLRPNVGLDSGPRVVGSRAQMWGPVTPEPGSCGAFMPRAGSRWCHADTERPRPCPPPEQTAAPSPANVRLPFPLPRPVTRPRQLRLMGIRCFSEGGASSPVPHPVFPTQERCINRHPGKGAVHQPSVQTPQETTQSVGGRHWGGAQGSLSGGGPGKRLGMRA